MNHENSQQIKYMPINIGPMFYRIMHENKDICIKTLEIILGFEIERLEYQSEEQTIETGLHSKGIRMDVYAKGENKVYDIEMQNYATRSLPKRARYYQSAIDTNNLLKSRDYDSLPESFIIFICPFDFYNKDWAIYRFEVLCKDDISINSEFGEHFIFLNTQAYMNAQSPALKALLNYINDGTVCDEDEFVKQLDNLVEQANKDKAWVSDMWEGVTFEETIENEIRALKREVETMEQKYEKRLEEAEAKIVTAEAERNNEFTSYLLDNNRIEDLRRCTKDPDFKKQVMEELKLNS